METKSDDNIIRRLGEASDDGVITYDLENKTLGYCNENFLRLFDLQRETLMADPALILRRLLPEDITYVKSRYSELLSKGHITETEFSIQVGGEVFKHINCQVLYIEENNLIVAFVKDITKQKSHDDFAVNFGARKDTLLDMLTHNLSGPLLLSKDILSSVTEGRLDSGKQAARILELLKENTQLCLDIVNDFLRDEHNVSMRTAVHKSRFDAVEKIKVTLDKLVEMNKDKTFILHKNEKSPVFIHSDAIKFFQVIHNLVSNAIKFTPSGGLIEIFVLEEPESVVVSVKDNGIGIPDSMKEVIFTERVTARPGLQGEKSSGIGLSIAKKLLEVMGGTIWFESDGQSGSTFSFRLPQL